MCMKKLIILAVIIYFVSANMQTKSCESKTSNITWYNSLTDSVKSISEKGCTALKTVVNSVDEDDIMNLKNKVSDGIENIKDGIINL